MFVPNSKLDMPELLYPGRKPVGNVKIDWLDEDAQGLTLCVIFQMGKYYDLVSGKQLTVSPLVKQNPNGAELNGSTAYVMVPDVVFGPTYTFTASIDDPNPTNTGIGYFVSYGNYSSPGSLSMTLGSSVGGKLKAWSDDSNPAYSLIGNYTATPFDAVFSVAAENRDGYLYVGGELDASNVGGWNRNMPPAKTVSSLYLGMRSDFDAARGWLGTMKIVFIHNYKIDAAMAKRLSDDPYRFMIPA